MRIHTLTQLTLATALALVATNAHAEWTMAPLEVSERGGNGSVADDAPDTDKEAERVSDGCGDYCNTRGDARESDAKPVCGVVSADPAYDFIQRIECGKTIGNDDFGAGYSLYSGVYTWERGANDKLRVDAGFDTQVTVFGRERTILGADAFFESTQSGDNYGRIDVIVLGDVMQGASRQIQVNFDYEWSLERTFFAVQQTIPIAGGLFTVSLEAGATGTIGATLNGGVANDIEARFTPSLDITGYASAAAGILGGAVAEAGVDIHLLILGVALPIELGVEIFPAAGQERDWSLGAVLEVESLSGWLEVWVTALFGLIEHRAVVASWSGLQKTYELGL